MLEFQRFQVSSLKVHQVSPLKGHQVSPLKVHQVLPLKVQLLERQPLEALQLVR